MDAHTITLPIYYFSDGRRIAASTLARAQEMHDAGLNNVADYYVEPGKLLSLEGVSVRAEKIAYYQDGMVPR